MKEGPDIARLAALIGDPARANMLTALMTGRALTARELALEAGVTPATASGHLARLAEGGLIETRSEGRHKYIRLAGDHVAQALETLMGLAARTGHLRNRPGPRDPALRAARVCYNHLAGDRGLQLHDSLVARGLLIPGDGMALTDRGRAFARDFGLDLAALETSRAPLCRPCLDWSERRHHIAGPLGRALLARLETLGWLRRRPGTHILDLTPGGCRQFDRAFPLP